MNENIINTLDLTIESVVVKLSVYYATKSALRTFIYFYVFKTYNVGFISLMFASKKLFSLSLTIFKQ